ncbi:MAG: BamA/TamA family outer membrane protein [Deltaproteobacteria bacterium]|nr:BamA/TamA family outer membrane protein [Deltaproteobacteria bacterium]
MFSPRKPRALHCILLMAFCVWCAPSMAKAEAKGGLRFAGEVVDNPRDLEALLNLDPLNSKMWALVLTRLPRCDKQVAAVSTSAQDVPNRTRRLLDELGYCVERVEARPEGPTLRLKRQTVVRKVFVRGNWPLFEEDVLRRVRFRTGQRLPPAGPARVKAIKRERRRLQRFLEREGYPRSKVAIRCDKPDSSGRVDVRIRLSKGKRYQVGEVKLTPVGLSREASRSWEPAIPRKEITDLFRNKIAFLGFKRAFSTDRFKENIERLVKRYHQRGFPGVRIKGEYRLDEKLPASRAVRVSLSIQERKKVLVEYEGNAHLAATKLNKQLTLFTSGSYDDYELAESAKKMVRLYRSEGYLQARLRFSREQMALEEGRARDRVIFHIHEGRQFRVERVRFRGNTQISDKALRKAVKTVPYPWFFGLGEGGFVTLRQIRQDVKRLEEHYQQRGFSRVKVQGEVAPNPQLLGLPGALALALGSKQPGGSGKAYVRFTIREGAQVQVGEVALEGIRGRDANRVRQQLKLRKGRPFTPALLKEEKARIVRFFAERGFPYAQVSAMESFDEDVQQQVDVRFTVARGEPVRFGGVFLRGNSATKAFVLRRAMAFKPGDIFDISKLERSERNLRKLGIFDSVRLQLLGVRLLRTTIPVLVRVEERYDNYGKIALGGGYSTDNQLFGTVGYTWRNFWGLGASLEAKGEFGVEIQSSNLNIHYPRLWGTEWATDLNFFLRNEITERLGDIFTYGAALTFSRVLLLRIRGFVRYEIRQIETEEPLNRPPGPVNERSTRSVQTRTGAFSAGVIYDHRDQPLTPTRGVRLETSVRGASNYFGGTDDFLTLKVYGQGFIPLPWGITIAMGLRYDHGFPLGGAVVLPKVERFFAGGDTTIRGVEEDRAFAERIESPLSPLGGTSLVKLVPLGGNIRLLTNIELVFPLWKLKLIGFPLLGAVFLDNGVVLNSLEDSHWEDFRHSLGVAIRLNTWVGFLSLEYAWPLDPELGDPRGGRLHFNFGFIF